jgi:hypothetical protein
VTASKGRRGQRQLLEVEVQDAVAVLGAGDPEIARGEVAAGRFPALHQVEEPSAGAADVEDFAFRGKRAVEFPRQDSAVVSQAAGVAVVIDGVVDIGVILARGTRVEHLGIRFFALRVS